MDRTPENGHLNRCIDHSIPYKIYVLFSLMLKLGILHALLPILTSWVISIL